MDRISTTAVNIIIALAAVLTFILIIVVARRRHVTITEVINGTGNFDLDHYIEGATAAFRLAVGEEMKKTLETVHQYHEKVHGNVAERCYALDFPEMKDALINRQDDTLERLAASLENSGSRSLASQLQTLAAAIVRPRGATVKATLHQPMTHDHRLGVAVEVISPASRFAQRYILWEPRKPARKVTLDARIDTLLRPAARCAAIELEAWVLQRSPRRFSLRYGNRHQLRHRSRQQEGLARNMCGLLMNASAEDFDDFADRFREFALDEFKAAVALLPKEYQPHYNLAIINEAAGNAAADSGERYKFFAAATHEYDAAMNVSKKLPEPGKTDVQRKINIGRLHAELISDIPKLRDSALGKLTAKGKPDFPADWPARRPEHPRRRNGAEHDAVKSALDDATADCLYNSACVYALAADKATGRDFDAIRGSWDRHARRLLGAAFVRDGSHGYLWSKAATDPDLRRLAYHLDKFMTQLREQVVDAPLDPDDPAQIAKMVDEVAATAGWVARAPVSRWLSKARWPDSSHARWATESQHRYAHVGGHKAHN